MKTILCYGDSNTFGAHPDGITRYDRHTRWPGVLRDQLGDDYEVLEEGLGGRTTVLEDPSDPYRNGRNYLIPCLASHQPLDLVIIMLGTNDLQACFRLGAVGIARGAAELVRIALASSDPSGHTPQVLLIAPPPVLPMVNAFEALAGAHEKSVGFAANYQAVAAECGCYFLDAGSVIVSSPIDGVHFDAPEHVKLGRAVAAKVREIFAGA